MLYRWRRISLCHLDVLDRWLMVLHWGWCSVRHWGQAGGTLEPAALCGQPVLAQRTSLGQADGVALGPALCERLVLHKFVPHVVPLAPHKFVPPGRAGPLADGTALERPLSEQLEQHKLVRQHRKRDRRRSRLESRTRGERRAY